MPETGIAELQEIIRVIKQKYNYDFSVYSPAPLRFSIDRVMHNHYLKYPEHLVSRILEDADFFEEFLHEISQSSFELFRDPQSWDFIRENILPSLFASSAKPEIWFPAASNGASLFSLLMMLKLNFPDKKAQISLSSLSEINLSQISSGIVCNRCVEGGLDNFRKLFPLHELKDFFKPSGKNFSFEDPSLKNIHFIKQDLNFNGMKDGVAMIILRNILLNYNLDYQNIVLSIITSLLKPGGFLIIGINENIQDFVNSHKNLIMLEGPENIYKKI
ncbi:MAG: hypothetical protein H6538_01115 [Bacteroidales bacterium]|nr:hypothetical protein [Bacteroidales bacterium]MCB9012642.1 hypothetical protein [Bacteroidales bacterium]